jgi:small-conductance mechanosensitive channel
MEQSMINRTVSVPASVLALLAHGAPAYAIICNDIDTTIQAHRDRQAELTEAQTTFLATADAEGRELTVEEGQQLDELSAEFDRLDNEINRRARAQTQFEAITASAGRQADPDPTPDEPIAAATPSVRNAAPSARVN